MIDQTLSQILNELYRLTSSVQQAAQELASKDEQIAELQQRVAFLEEPSKDVLEEPTD